MVHARYHRRFVLFRLRPLFVRIGCVRWDLHAIPRRIFRFVIGVWDCEREVQEKGMEAVQLIWLIDADKIRRCSEEKIRNVEPLFAAPVFAEFLTSFKTQAWIVMKDMVTIIIVGVSLVQVTAEFIESLFGREAA